MPKILYLGIFAAIMSAVSFVMMGVDKKRAKKHAYRISEKMLFLPVILGGGLGGILGMQYFRHKTKHWYFVLGFPLIFCAEVGAVIFLFVRGYI